MDEKKTDDGGCCCSGAGMKDGAAAEGIPAGVGSAGSDEKVKKLDLLIPSAEEARELERFIDSGHRSSHTITLLTLLGMVVLLAGLLYWDKLDLYPYQGAASRQWQPFGEKILPALVKNQHIKEVKSYRLQPGVENAPETPYWPETMYGKLRMDLYIIAAMVLVLCWVLLRIERARGRRNDLLAFRALAREIEKLRLRIHDLESKCATTKSNKIDMSGEAKDNL